MTEALELFGRDLFGEVVVQKPTGPLAERFYFPPFTVFDARSGQWQERKRAWLAMGIQSEIGRGDNLHGYSDAAYQFGYTENADGTPKNLTTRPGLAKAYTDELLGKSKSYKMNGRPPHGPIVKQNEDGTLRYEPANTTAATRAKTRGAYKTFRLGLDGNADNGWQQEDMKGSGTSVFDPTLTEILYRWFSPTGGQVIDPFAGGSVRGIVAGALDRDYWGCDLRPEQIAANEIQADDIPTARRPAWVAGDALDMVPDAPRADFILTCPPYGDLERYSDDPADLSTMEWTEFMCNYRQIIAHTAGRLKFNRFASFVVGNYRDHKGHYRDLVGETIRAFEACGCGFYNEGVLVTPAGSAPIRAGKQFDASRKLVRTHQNILVFVKGDFKVATAAVMAT